MKVLACCVVIVAFFAASYARPSRHLRKLGEWNDLERNVRGKAFSLNKSGGKRLGEVWTNCSKCKIHQMYLCLFNLFLLQLQPAI